MTSLTHKAETSFEERLHALYERIDQSDIADKDDARALLHALSRLPLGIQLITHASLNGKWTKYCVADQVLRPLTDNQKKALPPLESFLLFRAPSVVATQERFAIFRRVSQALVKSGKTLASIPCGYMDDLLSLDYSKASGVTLVGLDIDPEAIEGARKNAQTYGRAVETHIANAWALNDFASRFDVITSNGLNIYATTKTQEEDLYHSFAKALKPSGVLITSFLTPPPGAHQSSTWRIADQEAAALQKYLFVDILGVGWRAMRSEGEMRTALAKAGFRTTHVIYDSQRLFPTIVAQLT